MKPFDTAYVRMTAWYVLIIMTISLLFSVWVFNQARSELRTGLSRVVELKPFIVDYQQPDAYSGVVSGELNNSRGRLLSRLVLMNLAVLVVGSVVSYALARRTMRPIEESMEAQERFTADASHELRTPLAAMKTEIEVGLRAGKSLTKDEAVALLESNLEEIDRMRGLADGLLTLTQTDTDLPMSLQKLSPIVEKVIARMRPVAEDKKITVQSDLQPTQVRADEASVDTIAGILLDNALKYSRSGTTVTVATYQKDGHGYLAVSDEGIGIKASELPHIFDRFYRADTSRSKLRVPGHGLGLSIAKKLAEQMGAPLTATSVPGKGSQFVVRFTLSQTN